MRIIPSLLFDPIPGRISRSTFAMMFSLMLLFGAAAGAGAGAEATTAANASISDEISVASIEQNVTDAMAIEPANPSIGYVESPERDGVTSVRSPGEMPERLTERVTTTVDLLLVNHAPTPIYTAHIESSEWIRETMLPAQKSFVSMIIRITIPAVLITGDAVARFTYHNKGWLPVGLIEIWFNYLALVLVSGWLYHNLRRVTDGVR